MYPVAISALRETGDARLKKLEDELAHWHRYVTAVVAQLNADRRFN
jgi:hypothetical protein